MPVTMTARVFSGRPDPRWRLTRKQVERLLMQLRGATPRAGLIRFRYGGLGYHGFSLEPIDEHDDFLRGPISIYGGTIDFGDAATTRIDDERQIERWLLSLQPRADPVMLTRIRREFDTIYTDRECGAPTGSRTLAGRPIFNPSIWSNPAVQGSNNCYSYANNLFSFSTGDHATPGESVGAPVVAGSCAIFKAAAIKDKLAAITRIPSTGAPIALFIASDHSDYHWYRQDRSGHWSHKPGGWPARSCDESGDPITDPRTADTLDYVFCKLFKTGPAAQAVIR